MGDRRSRPRASVVREGEDLHFLETLLGIFPDNGSGQTECLLLLAPLIALVLLRGCIWRTRDSAYSPLLGRTDKWSRFRF